MTPTAPTNHVRALMLASRPLRLASRPLLASSLAYREALDLAETLVPQGLLMSPRQVVVTLQALTVGFFQQRTLYPSLVDDEDVRGAYRAVAAALSVGRAGR
jgi:hypothetical protein